MSVRAKLIVLLSIVLFVALAIQCRRVSASEPAALKVVNPITGDEWFNNKTVGDTFLANIEVFNVTDLTTFQIMLTWDPAILDYFGYEVPQNAVFPPPEFDIGPPSPGPDVSVPGQLIYGINAGAGQPAFTGDGICFQIEFKVLAFGATLLHLDPYPSSNTFLLSGLNEMPFTTVDGRYALTRPQIFADVNGDGVVNVKDISMVVAAFNSFPNTPRWNVLADLDLNGRIDLRDIAIVVLNFGKHT